MTPFHRLSKRLIDRGSFLVRMLSILVGELVDAKQRWKDISWYAIRGRKKLHLTHVNGDRSYGENICVFALYQKNGIEENVFFQLSEIVRQGYSLHVVSNLPVNDADLRRLKAMCVNITIRDNVGRDFGAYKDGVLFELDRFREGGEINSLLLMNDSIYFPLHDPTEIFESMSSQKVDFWGLTENFEISYHVQSFFIVFNKSVVESDRFYQYWSRYKYNSTRRYAIYKGEIGLSRMLIRAGFCSAVAYPAEDFVNDLQGRDIDYYAEFLEYLPQLGSKKISSVTEAAGQIYRGRHDGEFAIAQGLVGATFLKSEIRKQLVELYQFSSPTHMFYFYLGGKNNPCLKKDICYRGLFDVAEVLAQLHPTTIIDMTEIKASLYRKGVMKNESLLTRLLFIGGYV
jgi:hypothetical protein